MEWVLLLVLLEDPDLGRFPDSWTANWQMTECRKHTQRLRYLQCVVGYSIELQAAIDETQWRLDYWEALWRCHNPGTDDGLVQAMTKMQAILGLAYYEKGYRPPQIEWKGKEPWDTECVPRMGGAQ